MSRSRWATRVGRGRLAARLAVVVPLGMVGASLLGGSAALALPSGCAQSGSTVTCTFDYTGAAQDWTVPAEVAQATFTLYGAKGGTGSLTGNGAGGLGAEVIGTLPVTPGTVLQVNVGQAGNFNLQTVFGGGAAGGDDGASGGGASDIRSPASDSSYPPANRLLVAAGGGGGGVGGTGTGVTTGGAGGNAGSAGQTAATETSDVPGVVGLVGGVGGGPGTSTAGGAGGAGGNASIDNDTCAPFFGGDNGGAGGSGVGGAGGELVGGGGGGGGYYGGGGGGGGGGSSDNHSNPDECGDEVSGGGGGGGGSSFLGSATGTTLDNGASAPGAGGNGEVIITYTGGDLAIASHPDITVPATGSSGAVVTYTAPAVTDPDDASAPAAVCTPASGSTFAIGTTKVTCTATDSDDPDSPVSTSFTVTVTDTDLAIASHPPVTVDATGPSGAVVTYTAPAVTDPDDASAPAAVCTPASGSTFAIGTTTVHCSATDSDDADSPVSTSFTVTVKGAAAQLADLYQAVRGTGLASTVAAAQREVASGQPQRACVMLSVFLFEVEAEVPFGVGPGTAATLVADAMRIQAVLGCSSSNWFF